MRAAIGLALLAVGAAHAHAEAPPPGLWQWNLAPWLLALMLLSAALYALGVLRLWRHAGVGRGVARWQAASFAGGWLALAAALVSPLDALGARLFAAHMLQHELLMVVAAPLLVLGRPLAAWAWALPSAARGGAGRVFRSRGWSAVWSLLTDPLVAWSLHALALWLWHVPALFDGALRSEPLHIAQHASFLVTALFFWWAALGHDDRGRYGPGHATLLLFTTMLHTAALGALLALAPTPWYAVYAGQAGTFGLDTLEDQQLGGLVMWVPSGLAYLIAALAVIGRVLVRVRT